MRKILYTLFLVGIIAFFSTVVWAMPFYYPPENNPDITWEGQFPYQRNIMMDFTANPVGPVGPIPGADYEGYDDPILWVSDFVTMSGNVRWDQAVGGVGIWGGGSGTVTFHFDNWERDWPIKYFYEELIFKVEIVTGSIYQDFMTPDGLNMYTDSWSKVDNLGGGRYRLSIWAEFQPNPPWEEKIFALSSTTGNIFIEELHIATECIPEPATMALLGFGALILARKNIA